MRRQLPTTTKAREAYVAALRLLSGRRLSEAQLRARLERRGFDDAAIGGAVVRCAGDGFLDDALFARFYVEGRCKPVGDRRLVAELVQRGIDRDVAARQVAAADASEERRAAEALERLVRKRAGLSYPAAAAALERLGFPASLVYRILRAHACAHGPFPAEVPAARAGNLEVHDAEGALIRACE